jgi:predicted alpha/beta superfamily hydrolase
MTGWATARPGGGAAASILSSVQLHRTANALTPTLVASSRLERLPAFASRFLDRPRDVLVYLPPGYEQERDRRYPVLYMHDGQNLFDPDTAYVRGQHWRLGEMADMLSSEGRIQPLIIVGVNHTGIGRVQEYTPTKMPKLGGGLGKAYGRLLTEELKPIIDARYRTLPGRTHTGLGGSSLGGLSTMYLGLRHAGVFGRLAVMSPSVWWGRRAILRYVAKARPRPSTRVWLDIGTAEGKMAVADTRRLRDALLDAGWRPDVDLEYVEAPGGTHSEGAWAARVGDVLAFLFPGDFC